MTLDAWNSLFQAEVGAAAALAGLPFVSVSSNQVRILELGRMADRGLEALAMPLLVLAISSLASVPGRSLRLLRAEVLGAGAAALAALVPLQLAYLCQVDRAYRRHSRRMVAVNRLVLTAIALAGAIRVWRDDSTGIYLLPPDILLSLLRRGRQRVGSAHLDQPLTASRHPPVPDAVSISARLRAAEIEQRRNSCPSRGSEIRIQKT
jgi:hypothetical protein